MPLVFISPGIDSETVVAECESESCTMFLVEFLSNLSFSSNTCTQLGSGSEWPKEEALLLTMVSYLKKLMKIET